ncbi:hypothetical protein [Amantichitinum ursilacus]|uniref:Uncharacterized protein n=1 Tax=Amantichitinum ursilacus TaxID=857265 RepID=A0A0N0GL57_9NEIS|nr:hypothetical protein [Amantichitinum ursilacus]KPC49545.1 hypothetical protein WG78_19515 [Amantichitinum ursilacus]
MSSISGLSSSNYSYSSTGSDELKQRRQNYKALESALNSGDLSASQSAYAALQAQSGSASSASSTASGSTSNSPQQQFQTDFAALGKALSSGDISSAQSAFATLQSDRPKGPPPGDQNGGAIQQVASDLNAVQSALSSSDLSSAKTTFSTLLKDLQAAMGGSSASDAASGSTSSATAAASGSTDTISNDFTALQNALSGNDLSTAQSAFSTLMTDISSAAQTQQAQRPMGPPPPPPGADNDSGDDPLGDDLTTLANAIDSGDLSTAQSLFAQIQQGLTTGQANAGSDSTDSSSDSSVSDALSALSTALTSKDSSKAQSAFGSLLDTLGYTEVDDTDDSDYASAAATASDSLNSDFSTLASALNSGDLTAARDAFSTLQQNRAAYQQAQASNPYLTARFGIDTSGGSVNVAA